MIGRATIAVTLGALAIVFLASLTLCSRADAQQPGQCLPADTWLTTLAEEYGEHPTVTGTMGQNTATFTINPETGTWSMLITVGPGMCMMAAGKNWKTHDAPEIVPNKAPEIYKRRNIDGWFTVVTRPA